MIIGLAFCSSGAAQQPDQKLSFNRDIRPILSDNCFACHGPDRANRKAELRLDVRDEAVKSGAIKPGSPDASELVARILLDADDEGVMPPRDSRKTLNARQRDLLRRWIAEGAEYQLHWALVPPTKFEPPAVVEPAHRPAGELAKENGQPKLARISQSRNAIDRFIRARLRSEGLSPSPEASKETLIRRVTLDLTGLPPTPDEVDAFLNDTSEEAYERVVDRLLKSPHYGERMAIDWLDAARYADSNGYQVDRDRELWPWRDWVIRAFNENKPFDQFTIEQLAGDLLPNATVEQRIATGFHRNHMLNEEGGIIAEEFLAEYTADRVETTAAVWLGQTFNCARCHDHKYDPFTQRDFYSLKAFFHNVPERGVGNYGSPIRVNAPPFLRLPTPAQESQLADVNAKLASATRRMKDIADATAADVDAWAARVVAPDSVRWTPSEFVSVSGGKPAATLDESHFEGVVPPQSKRESIQFRLRASRDRIAAFRIEVANTAMNADDDKATVQLLEVKLAAAPNADANSKSPATKSPGNAKSEKPRVVAIRAASAGDSLPTEAVAKLLAGGGKPDSAIALKSTTKQSIVVVLETPLEAPAAATNGATADAESRDLELTLGLLGGTADAAKPNDSPTRWRVFTTDVAAEQLVPANLLALAAKETGKRTPAETKQLVDFRLAQHDEHRRATADVETYKKQIAATEAEVVTTLVMDEQPQPRATHILMRGVYDKPGEAVAAATPAVLPPLDPAAPRNRLGLARWLVGPENPLTARVTVNRFWQQLFGTGLVRTSEDFGAQGEAPSHPELLDWLAVTFREGGWDVKNLVRLLVTSATYRQQSQASAELRQRDPDNRWLSRGPRHRLIGELVRDQALVASGLLARTIGGPSVKPYHPPGLYEQVTAGSGYNVYVPGKGDDLHRRSLYTYWKRSVPHPAMLIFDAPFRETCALRRSRSNTPLQALNLLNDPTYVEAANHLGRRMLVEGGETVDQRLVHGFRLVLSRRPRDLELKVLRAAYDRALADFQRDPDSAIALLNVGDSPVGPKPSAKPAKTLGEKLSPRAESATGTEANSGRDQIAAPAQLAAFATVAATLLNLDECVTKE